MRATSRALLSVLTAVLLAGLLPMAPLAEAVENQAPSTGMSVLVEGSRIATSTGASGAETSSIDLGAGGYYMCGVQQPSGELSCWGANWQRQAMPPAGTFLQADTGFEHSCVLRADGSIARWGDDYAGRIDSIPGPFITLVIGQAYTCGLRPDASLGCWGANW